MWDQDLIDNYELKTVMRSYEKSNYFISFNYGCNTIAGTAKGIVEDVKSVVPGL